MAKEEFQFTNFESLTPEQRSIVDSFMEAREAVLKESYWEEVVADLDKYIVSRLRFHTVKVINAEKITDARHTFVLPILFKPGTTHFILRTPLDT